MASKKEKWDIGKDAKGTKTTTETDDDGNQKVTVQEAHLNWIGDKRATTIISEEKITPPKDKEG
jgi:hypothetical protein